MTAGLDVIRAGGIAVGQPPADGSDVDVVTARSYRHTVLPDRVVVRLVPASLGEAEDLAGEFLGLAVAAEPVPVGHGARQALGFPAWALVHDPANGRHALALVKDMEYLARVAKTKPGNAKDGYDALAIRLGAAAPHFLPTFWEQAGRAFIAAESAKPAGVCFGRARDAERTYALAVDEERLAVVHLEFALAGALTAKSLTQYGRELADRRPADEAYERFRSIARQRVAGGLPPHSSLADDLARLARAAKLQVADEAERFIGELLAYPAVAKAVPGFWKSYHQALVSLSQKDEAVRLALLAILPDPPGYDTDLTDEWIGLLDATGASDRLVAGALPSTLDNGVSGWLERLVGHRHRGWGRVARSPRLLALVQRLVPHLRDEGRPLAIATTTARGIEWDLIDLCLAEGVQLADPAADLTMTLAYWLDDEQPGRRELDAAAGDPQYGPVLRRCAVLALQHRHRRAGAGALSPDDLDRITAARGVRLALADWLAELADSTADVTVLTLADLLDRVRPLCSPGGVALAPEAMRRLAATDVAEVLAANLRAGLVAEYGWPAYDEAVARLGPEYPLRTEVCWPYVVVQDLHRAVVVGPDGVVLEHDLRLPAPAQPHNPPWATYVDGQLLVAWRDVSMETRAYWSGRPDRVFDYDKRFEPDLRRAALPSPTLVQLPDGGATTGAQRWQPGDTWSPDRYAVSTDGTTRWRLEHAGWREFDPATGTVGRFSVPAQLDVPGVDPQASHVLTAPPEFAASPLGWLDGLVGWRVLPQPDGTLLGEGVDGRAVRWRPILGPHRRLAGALAFPGAPERYAVTITTPMRPSDEVIDIWLGDQVVDRVSPGESAPPLGLWHAMRPRDEAGSAALRAMTAQTAARLLTAVSERAAEDAHRRPLVEAVGDLVPELGPGPLRAAVATLVWAAKAGARELDTVAAMLDAAPDGPEAIRAPLIDTPSLRRALACVVAWPALDLGYRHWPGNHLGGGSGMEILVVGGLLNGVKPQAGAFASTPGDSDWCSALRGLRAVGLRAAAVATEPAERAALLGLLEALAAAGLTDGPVRLVLGRRTITTPGATTTVNGTLLRSGPDRVGVIVGWLTLSYNHNTGLRNELVEIIEVDPTGTFGPIQGCEILDDLRPALWAADSIQALCARVRADGPAPLPPDAVDRLVAATGMTRGEAGLLLAGLPGLFAYQATFLPAATRQQLGLSQAEARTGRQALRAVPVPILGACLAAGLPDDPEILWRDGPDVAAMAAAWIASGRASVRVAEDVLLDAGRALPGRGGVDLVRSLVDPQSSRWLRGDEPMSHSDLRMSVVALPWLTYRMPAHDPARAGLPLAYRMLRARLAHPGLHFETHHGGTDVADPGLPAVERVVGANPYFTVFRLYPARLTGPEDPALAYSPGLDLGFLLSAELGRLMAAIEAEPGGAPMWPQDPRVSVPSLVDEVGQRHGLDPDVAAYYLQLLALPDPSDRIVTRYTGWSAAQVKKLRASLAATPLVVEGKRERAGRGAFLLGGWTALKAPNLPLERWKLALPGIRVMDDLVVVVSPVAELFHAAWGRVQAGDEPRLAAFGENL